MKLLAGFGMVCFTPFLYIVTREPLAETQTFRVLMDQLVLALTYFILLKCAHVRLPPICASWSEVTSEDLWDLHHVLALHMHGDVLAEEVSVAIRAAYDWHQLRQSGKVLSEMWFRVVRKQVPLPHALLTAIHVLEKRLAVPRLPCFPDGHALPWFTQCTTALRELVPSSMSSTTHALPLRISGEATSGLVETDASPSVAPASECPLAMHMLPDEGMDSSVDEAEEDLSDVNGDESPRHLQQKLELHSSTERDLNRFRILHRDFQQDRANGIDDGLSVDIPLWARKILDREEHVINTPNACAQSDSRVSTPEVDVPAAGGEQPSASSSSVRRERKARPLGPYRFLSLQSRPSKYGVCTFCGVPRKLHLIKTGRYSGEIWLRCSNFWDTSLNGKPRCWHGKRYSGEVPRSLLSMQKRLKSTLQWQLQHGPQTRR